MVGETDDGGRSMTERTDIIAAQRELSEAELLRRQAEIDEVWEWPAPGLDDTDLSESGSALELHRT
jgi:hypothetical protein